MATLLHEIGARGFLLPDVVFGFPESAAQASALAQAVGAEYRDVDVHVFPDGEARVTVPGEAHRPAIYRSFDKPNDKLVEVLLAASVLSNAGAKEMTLVAPYLPYMRQDSAFRPGEAVSQKVVAGLLARSFDRFLSVDPHLHRVISLDAVFEKPALSLTAAATMGRHSKDRGLDDAVVVGPDIESGPLVKAFAEAGDMPYMTALKARHGDRDVEIALPKQVNVAGRPAVIVDDVISSGATIQALAGLLKVAGAEHIDVYVTHALFDAPAAQAMTRAGVSRIFSSDSIVHESNAISLAPILAEGLRSWR
jgi:ribose-phosphate pyrophosphokinase